MAFRGRSFLIAIAGIVILLVVAVLALPALIDVNRYRPQIEARLERELNREVSLGDMRLTLFPLTFRVENATIKEDPAFQTGQPFAQAAVLHVRPELLPLIRGDIRIDSLKFENPKLELARNQQGVWNFVTLADKRREDGEIAEGEIAIDELEIVNGQIAVTDRHQDRPRTVYDQIDLLIRDFAPDRVFSLQGRARMPGATEQTIVIEGEAGPLQRDGLTRTTFEGTVELNAVSLAELQRFLKVRALENSDAVLTGNMNIRNDGGLFSSTGKLEAGGVMVRGTGVGYPITAGFNVRGDLNESTFQIEKADLKLGNTPLGIRGDVNARPAAPVVDLYLTTSGASVKEAARLAAALDMAFDANEDVSGTLRMNVRVHGPAKRPALEGEVAAGDLRIAGGELPQPVQVDAIELSLSPGAIRSNRFTARTAGTAVATQFAVSNYVSDDPNLELQVDTGTAQLGDLLSIARAFGVSAVEGISGSGIAHFNVSVAGPIKQRDRMTYSGNGSVQNATFNVPSVPRPVTVRKADLHFNANSIAAGNLDFVVAGTAARGNLTLRNPAAPRIEFALAADKVNLREWHELIRGGDTRPSKRTPSGAGRRPGLLQRSTGSGRLTADTVIYDELVLNNVRSTVRLDKGIVTMRPITAGMYGGEQVGAVVLNARNEPVTYTVDSNLRRVDANRLLSSISPARDALYGVLSADADIGFTATGDAASIARTLDGNVALNLQDGAIANMDLLNQLAAIAQFLRSPGPVDPATKVFRLTGDFAIKDGLARTGNLEARVEGGSLAAAGSIDLPGQKLDLRVTAVLSKEYSEAVGGTNIGGFMSTALVNRKGELVIPVIVTGSFQNPQFAPDLQKVARMKLEQLVPSSDNPSDFTIGIIERLIRGQEAETEQKDRAPEQEEPPAEEPQPEETPQPENVFPDLFEEIFKNPETDRSRR